MMKKQLKLLILYKIRMKSYDSSFFTLVCFNVLSSSNKNGKISFNDFLNRKGGTGTFARSVPLIQDEKFIQLCFDYPTSRKRM